MKQTATNEWKDGLNLDLHPIVTPNTVLTDNMNGTFITYNGNEFCLQNDRGNKFVTSITPGYTPIGIKEHNGILYIVSVNGNKTEIGTYPSLKMTSSDDTSFYDVDLDFQYEDIITQSGTISAYKPLRIGDGHAYFTNVELGYDLEHPVTIEIQDSYDGSVNLILVADNIPTKIINSGFTKKSDSTGMWIKRNQKNSDTNVYHLSDSKKLNQELNLIRTSNKLTKVNLLEVQSGGQFKGGNYTFYIKFGDADYNQTDVVAESGIVSIFHGNDGVPSTISGTLSDERTDKMIHLEISELNHVYSKIYIYYSREYSDTQGYRMTEYGMFNEPIDMGSENTQSIWLTGFEQTVPINSEELNVDYHTIDWARAEAQHSNMLFLGNVGSEETFKLYRYLENISKNIEPSVKQSSLPQVDLNYSGGSEYYSVKNIYNYVGYYPGEIYRFGIVYILEDGSKTPVFNVKNDGIVQIPNYTVITNNEIKPIYIEFKIPTITNENVLGWFIVRQKRIPNTVCEGLSIAIDRMSNVPVVYDGSDWITQSFLECTRDLIPTWQDQEGRRGRIIDPETGNWDNYDKWNGGGTHLMDVKLTYNNSIITQSSFTEEGFEEWLKSKSTEFSDYWVKLDTDEEYYAVEDSIVWDEDSTDPYYNLVNAITNLANQYVAKHSNYTPFNVFVDSSDIYEDKNRATDLVNQLKSGRSFSLKWYQKYKYTGEKNESGEIVDSPQKQYIVGIIDDLSEYDNLPVAQVGQNQVLLESWKSSYMGTLSSRKLTKKTLKELDYPGYWKEANALLSLDPCVAPTISSMLDGSKFHVELERSVTIEKVNNDLRLFANTNATKSGSNSKDIKCVFIPSNTGIKVVDDCEFSNTAGNASDVSVFKYFTFPNGVFEKKRVDIMKSLNNYFKSNPSAEDLPEDQQNNIHELYRTNLNINLIRGLFTPYIGLVNKDIDFPIGIYSVKHKAALGDNDINVRKHDNSQYYCVSDYTNSHTISVYRGDCFTNTVTMRIIRNFVDNTAPTADVILDPWGWRKYVVLRDMYGLDKDDRVDYSSVNLSDVNTVDLGLWVTFKCLSSYNLGLRSIDAFHTDELALLGSPRSFYPLNGASTATGNKMEETYLLNDGLSATVGRKRYNLIPNVPYSKSEFSNRIMFSNVNVTDAFTNGYRTFQGLSYKDYDKQYGAITKLISLGQNIFVVMEHGLGLVSVNPKALMQTTTGEAIHIYGHGVLPDEMTIISQDYGSKYEHSVIRTPIGIYGIDVDAKKIWRFSDKQGFETISDMKMETYLKDYLKSNPIKMSISDIRTHYNGKKGDVMFTWYPLEQGNSTFSICYNERQNMWTTKYDWYPIVSENINDKFYSLNENSIWVHSDKVGINDGHVSSWYGDNHKFEFEFVVSDPIGVSKIFDNLQIISNNVQPDEMEITVIGDDYMFNRKNIVAEEAEEDREEYDHNSQTTSNIHGNKTDKNTTKMSPYGYYHFDWRLNQSALTKWQPFKDIYRFGRRLGNIQYKDGMWYAQIEPLLVNDTRLVAKEARIRDKWAKIRIRYSGKDLAIITAIRTLINV